jgi:hypothetical protein
MSAEQINALDARGIAAKKGSNLSKLRQLVRDAQDHAVKECGHWQESFRDFMANQGVIPPILRPTARDLAETMTRGEAKALVQSLVQLYVTRPDRLQAFKAKYGTCKAVVDQMKAAQEPARKTAWQDRSPPDRSSLSTAQVVVFRLSFFFFLFSFFVAPLPRPKPRMRGREQAMTERNDPLVSFPERS